MNIFSGKDFVKRIPGESCCSVIAFYQRTYWATLRRVHSWTDMLQFKLITQATQGLYPFFQGTNCALLPINLSSVPDLSTSSARERLPLWRKKKEEKKSLGIGRETSAKAPRALLIINYVYIIFFLLPALEKKLKRAIVFLIPLGWKHLLRCCTVRGHTAD